MSTRTAAKSAKEKSIELEAIFGEMKAILQRHAKVFTERSDTVKNKNNYHLIVVKPQVIAGHKRDELWFASIIQQKDSVGFYFTLVSRDEVRAQLSSALLEHRDGGACFHFKTLTPQLKKDVQAALKIGVEVYRKQGWL